MAPVRTLKEMDSIGDLLEQLGGISPHRVRLDPPPGTATERDVIRIQDKTGRLCELIDGVLVEKVMGFQEANLATWLGYLLQRYLDDFDLGTVTGADGAVKLMPGLVRIPDLSYLVWEKLPGKIIPDRPIPNLVPDLAVEVLSKGNTPGEMLRKLRDYFISGVTLVWMVDPRTHTVTVHTAPDRSTLFTEADTLDGGELLPGLQLSEAKIFERLPPAQPPRKRRRSQ